MLKYAREGITHSNRPLLKEILRIQRKEEVPPLNKHLHSWFSTIVWGTKQYTKKRSVENDCSKSIQAHCLWAWFYWYIMLWRWPTSALYNLLRHQQLTTSPCFTWNTLFGIWKSNTVKNKCKSIRYLMIH